MDRSEHAARHHRVWTLIRAAARIAAPADPLGEEARQRLPEASGLSQAGVELALTSHLERHPEPSDVERLLGAARSAPRCHVLLASNVCIAAHRALAWALATAPRVLVRPSRRDPVLAELLVRAVAESTEPARAGWSLELCAELAPEPGDALHLYGSDRTVGELQSRLPPGVSVQAHGTGIGVGVVGSELGLEPAARALARDVVPFDQRGCLSPRLALVEGDAGRARALSAKLAQALDELARSVPRGPLAPADRAELARFVRTAEALGGCIVGSDHVVALDAAPRALLLPPALRCVWVVPCTAAEAPGLLAPWQQHVAALGGYEPAVAPGELARAAAAFVPAARRSPLGVMQQPPLDGPVDLRPLTGRENR